MSENIVRVNVYMSKVLREFYRDYAKEMGCSMSSAMVMGLKSYMDAQNGIKMSGDLKELMSKLEQLQISAESLSKSNP